MKWISSELACETFGSGSSILGFIPTIVADMALNLIIFAGLFVLRRNGGAAFGLSRLLWRQVRWRFSLTSHNFVNFFYSQGGHLARTCLHN
jgi:hypothetical protein